MTFKNKQIVYKTGALSGIAIPNEEIKIETCCYVKTIVNGQAVYLRICNGKYSFTDFSAATPFSQEQAVKYINYFKEKNIKTYIFPCAKKTF